MYDDKRNRAFHNPSYQTSTQVLHEVGGKHFVGVNYCAMNKYKGPKTKEQWDTVVRNLKARVCTQCLAFQWEKHSFADQRQTSYACRSLQVWPVI